MSKVYLIGAGPGDPDLITWKGRQILARAKGARILVVGDVMLDHFIWGSVARISPEAPVPVVDFERENFMPGGAANVARNLTALHVAAELFGIVGRDHSADGYSGGMGRGRSRYD